ncbi:MAG: cyclic nucleotide-binding domain-containing protein [Actinomycetota bacterium]
MQGLRAVRRALSNSQVLAAELGYAAFCVTMHGSWVAMLIYAFEQGGVGEAGIVGFAVLAPASLLAPVASVAFSRLPPHRSLAAGFAAQTVGLALVGAAIGVGAPRFVVYPTMALLLIPQLVSRPTMLSVLPVVVDDPAELAAANATAGLLETIGAFLGPPLAGFAILAAADPGAAFWTASAVMAAGTVAALRVPRVDRHPDDEPATQSPLAEAASTIRLLRREPDTRLLVIMMSLSLVIFGALNVALVAIAVDQLGRNEATAGLLAGAVGIGGVVGASMSFLLVGRRRLTTPIAVGLLSVALPIMALAATDSTVLVVALLALTGIGRPVLEVAGRTLLQGLSAEDTLARIFGVQEGLAMSALAVGNLSFSVVAVATDLATALFVFGLILPAVLALQYSRLRRIDDARPGVDPQLLRLIRRIPIFAPLPAFTIEQLLVNLGYVEFAPHATIFDRGDHGDLLYVVADGSAVVELADGEVETRAGGFFGEIALLRDQPRMAGVRAGADGMLCYTVEREVFLTAISGNGRSMARTVREVERRLGED